MAYRQTPQIQTRLLDNRTRILQAARRQVSEGGWEQTPISGVAAAAGMATGNVYRYFPSKAELFAEVVAAVSGRELEVLRDIAALPGSPALRLHMAVTIFVQRALRNPQLAYSMIAEPCDKAIDVERLKWRARVGECIVGLVTEGQKAGTMRRDLPPAVAATVIVGGFMEALVGPLSPMKAALSADSAASGASAEQHRTRGDELARQIATACCACVALPATPASNVSTLPARRRNRA